jgi:hypothetical protein
MFTNTDFWPGGARRAVTISMQFEAGGEPISGAPRPLDEPIRPGYPDLPQNSFYEYGIRVGIPRRLGLFDRHGIKVTSFMMATPSTSIPSSPPRSADFRARAARRWSPKHAGAQR